MSKPLPIQKSFSLQRAREMNGGAYKAKQEAKLRDASQLYEKRFLNEMVKAMRKTVQHSDLQKQSFAEKIYKDKLFDKYVNSWSQKGGVGIADIIYNQLHGKIFPKNFAPPSGPIPINGPSNKHFKIIKPQGKDLNFIFKKEPEANVSGLKVMSPWSGKISSLQELPDDRKLMEIDHKSGVRSRISFLGSIEGELGLGQEVKAGESLGRLSEKALGLSWQIQA